MALAVTAIALVQAGCGGYGDSPRETTAEGSTAVAQGQQDPGYAASEFLRALSERDAEGFCRLTMPDVQRQNFSAAGVPGGGSCAARAEAMFATARPDGTQPLWELLAGAKVGTIDLHCRPGTERCPTATVVVEDLLVRGGGTTRAPLRLTHTADGWRVGPL